MSLVRAEAVLVGRDSTAAMFRSFLRNSEVANKQFTSKFKATFQLITGGLIGVGLGRLAGLLNDVADRAEGFKNLADTFGTTTAEISRLDFAARRTNTSIDEVAGSFAKMFTAIGRGEEASKRQVAALRDLGLQARDLMALSLQDQIGAIADAWNEVTSPQDRVRIATDLFGGSMQKVVPLLKLGSQGLAELGRESDRTGNTMTAQMTARLDAAKKAFDRLSDASTGLKNRLAVGLTPAAILAAGALDKLASPDRSIELGMTIQYLEANIRLLEAVGLNAGRLRTALEAARGIGKPLELASADTPQQIHMLDELTVSVERISAAMVTAQKILPGYSESLQKMFMETMTDAQKATDAYAEFIAKLEILRDAGVIDQAELGRRREDFLDRTLKEVEVTAKKIFPEANKGAKDLMETLRDEGARRAVGYISDAIMGLDDGARNFAKSMVDAFRKILADQAAQHFFAMFSDFGSENKDAGGLLGALAKGANWLFGSSGAPGSTPTVPKLAGGGFMPPFTAAIVGDGGKPELALAGRQGATIVPLERARGRAGGDTHVTVAPNYNIHIDSRADRGQIYRDVATMIEYGNKALEVQIIEGFQRRRYRI